MKYIILILSLGLAMASCELVETLDTEDPNNLGDENAVLTQADSESILIGAYSNMNQDAYYSRLHPVYGPLLSGYGSSTGSTTRTITFQTESNTVTPDENALGNTWDDCYDLANAASNVIALVGALDNALFTPASRQGEIIAEAHFLRALAHFDALRFWGRFWDTSSALGIPLRVEPGDAANANLPRSTVAESYAQIITDLDNAIANGPDFSNSWLASKQAAMALKARVALYMGDNSLANTLATQVLADANFSLEANYADIFTNRLSSSELIFGMFASVTEGSGHSFFYVVPPGGRYDYAPSQKLVDLLANDPRSATTLTVTGLGPQVNKYPNLAAGDDPSYIIRLGEVQLIKAEALARGAGSVADARDALNVIRMRAGVAPSTAATVAAVLAEIQEEKVKELAFEGSHEWFDAIRFGNIMQIKASVTNENKYVLPIPDIEVDPNDNLDQNPGY